MESEGPQQSQPQPESKPNMKQELLEMGFTLERIQQILPKCDSKQQAIQYLLGQKQQPFQNEKGEQNQQDWIDNEDEDYKMIFVVRMDLKLTLNKIAETVATSCLEAYKQIQRKSKVDELDQLAWINWTEGNQRKIVVKAKSEQELRDVLQKVSNTHINYVTLSQLPSKLIGPKQTKPQKKHKKDKAEDKKEEKNQEKEGKEEKTQQSKNNENKVEMIDENKEQKKQETKGVQKEEPQKMKPQVSVEPEKMQIQKVQDSEEKLKRKEERAKKKKEKKEKAKEQQKKLDQTEKKQEQITGQKEQQKQVLVLVCFGPASETELDPLTKHFKLL